MRPPSRHRVEHSWYRTQCAASAMMTRGIQSSSSSSEDAIGADGTAIDFVTAINGASGVSADAIDGGAVVADDVDVAVAEDVAVDMTFIAFARVFISFAISFVPAIDVVPAITSSTWRVFNSDPVDTVSSFCLDLLHLIRSEERLGGGAGGGGGFRFVSTTAAAGAGVAAGLIIRVLFFLGLRVVKDLLLVPLLPPF